MALISDYLTFTEKLEFKCVCKTWQSIITKTTLYNKLVFRDRKKFKQAVDFCNKNEEIKKYVRDLGVFDFDYGTKFVLALPAIFPKITSLHVENYRTIGYLDIEKVDKVACSRTLAQWKDIESLVE